MSGDNNINSQNQNNLRNQFILKGGIKKEQVDKKYHLLFDMYDSDGNKTLDSNEASLLSSVIANSNKTDKKQDVRTINDFAKNLSTAGENIIDSKTTVNSDGSKTIVTLYNNETMETVTYYPDGEIKMKRIDKKVTEKSYIIGGKKYTVEQYKKMLNNPELDTTLLASAIPNTNTSMTTKIEFSERGQRELRKFTGEHFKETVEEQYNLMQKFDYTSGDLDKLGLFVSDSAQELFSKVSGEEYNTYAELWNKTRQNLKKTGEIFMAGNVEPNSPYALAHPEYNFETVYKNTTGQDYNILQADEFQQTTIKYQTITALKQRTEMLNDSIKTIDTLYREEQLKKQGITVPNREKSFDEVLMDTLTQYFDGNSETAATFLAGISSDIKSKEDITPEKMIGILKEIKDITQKRYNNELGGEKYENIKDRYLQEYKEFYGVENRKDEIESNIATGQMTGEMMKMGVVITTSIMLGGSNLLQQGGKALAEKLGPTAAKEAIRLGMSMGSIAESYGIDLLNAMSSQEGLTEDKKDALIQKQISNLPYMMFGVYVSGPVGDSVKNMLKANPNISSELLKNVFSKATSTAGFATEVSADALFELTLNGGDITGVFGSNAQGEAFGRFMNMLVGGRANKAAMNALEGVSIKQETLPDGTIEYTTRNKDGVEFKTKKPEEIVMGVLGFAAQKSTEGRNIKQMPDGTLVEYDKNGKPMVLNDAKIHPNDQVNHINQPDGGIPTVKQDNTLSTLSYKEIFENKKTISTQEANNILRQYNLTESDIAEIRNTIKDSEALNAYINAMDIISRYEGDSNFNEMSVNEIKELLLEIDPNSKDIEIMKLINSDNLQQIQHMFKTPNDKESIEVLVKLWEESQDNPDYEKVWNKSVEIFNQTGAPFKDIFDRFSNAYKYSPEEIDQLTPERIIANEQITQALGTDYYFGAALSIKDPSKITPEFIQEFKVEYDKLKNLNIDTNYDDPVEALAEFKKISEFSKQYGFDFSWNKKGTVSRESILKLLALKDPSEAKGFINNISEEFKDKYANYIMRFATREDVLTNSQDYVDFFNYYAQIESFAHMPSNASSPTSFISELNNIGVKDIGGVAKMLEAFNEVNAYPSWHNFFEAFNIKDDNYEAAAEYIKSLPEIFKDNSYSGGMKNSVENYITYNWKPDVDFKIANERVKALKEKNLTFDMDKNILQTIVSSKNDDIVDIFALLKDYGVSYDGAINAILSNDNLSVQMLQEKIDVITNKLIAENPDSENIDPKFLHKLFNAKTNNNYILAGLVNENWDINTARSSYEYNLGDNIATKYDMYNKYNARMDDLDIISSLLKVDNNNVKIAELLYSNTEFPSDIIKDIISASNSENQSFAIDLCNDKDFPKENIANIVKNIKKQNERFARDLCNDKDFPKKYVADIIRLINKENEAFARDLCNDKDFDKAHISKIVENTNEKNLNFARQLYEDKKVPQQDIAIILSAVRFDDAKLAMIKDLYNDQTLNSNHIASIAKYIDKKENYDDFKNIYERPELRNWLNTNLDNGLDLKSINELSKTQLKLNSEKEANINKKESKEAKVVKTEIESAKSEDIVNAESQLVALGVHPKMAPNYVKMAQENGIVDKTKLEAVCALAQVGVPVKEIKNIFNIATGSPLSNMNGIFRPDIIKDIVVLKQSGIDDIKLATNLSAVKNMSEVELKSRINGKVREDLISRIDNLPIEIKNNLIANNYDLEALKAKAKVEVKAQNVKPAEVPTFKLRSLDSIVGVEKIVLNKFKTEIDQNIWGNPERFKAWAKERLDKIIDFENNPNYVATGNYAQYNAARKEGIANWYKYLTEESNYKDDVFVHLLVMDGITKEMRPNNAVTPPAVTHESFEATYNALLEQNSSVSFSKIYAQQTKQKAIHKYTTQEVLFDGIEGKWVTIPRSKKGEPNYDEHIAMVQALAEGSSWCLRFENAHGYLQGGNLHFFVDKNGNSQVAINETDGTITQIQKRYNQDSTVPVAYSQIIANWAKENNYNGKERDIETALNAKPKFDNLRKQIADLQKNNDYLGVFKLLNINVENAPDGTYIISEYNPKYNAQYTLFDLGVDENALMQNVSEVSSSLNLDGSSLTSLKKLKKIAGKLNLGDNKINDLRSLEMINGKKVYWE